MGVVCCIRALACRFPGHWRPDPGGVGSTADSALVIDDDSDADVDVDAEDYGDEDVYNYDDDDDSMGSSDEDGFVDLTRSGRKQRVHGDGGGGGGGGDGGGGAQTDGLVDDDIIDLCD